MPRINRPQVKPAKIRFHLVGARLLLIAIATLLCHCAAVKPYEREFLADPITDLSSKAKEAGVERHFVETIEAGSGGDGGAGGGCACN
jgi:hypothetical protein